MFLERIPTRHTWNIPSSSLPRSGGFSVMFEGLASVFNLFSDLEDISFFLF